MEGAGVPNARYDAREIFAHVGGFSRIALTDPAVSTNDARVISAIEQRCRRVPLQYIIGNVGFFRESYEVTEDCLIPRSDTELLVEYAVEHLPAGAHFLDLCTGSGCVGISVLANTSGTTAQLVDISEGALAVAARNAAANGVSHRARLTCADVLADVIEAPVYAVLSNPPYIREEVYEALEPEIFHEPRIAFVAEREGLEFYERITELYASVIAEDGFIAYEIGYDQADAIRNIAAGAGLSCELLYDLGGNVRVAVLRR
jgi:release factor glutamine methyltransferase